MTNSLVDPLLRRYQIAAMICLVLMVILAVVGVVAVKQTDMPLSSNQFMVVPEDNGLVWYNLAGYSDEKPCIHLFDFETQSVSVKRRRELKVSSEMIANGRRALIIESPSQPAYVLMLDPQTHAQLERIWLPASNQPQILAGKYLIDAIAGNLLVTNLLDENRVMRSTQLMDWQSRRMTRVHAISDSNLVLVSIGLQAVPPGAGKRSIPQNSIQVFRVLEDKIELAATWKASGAEPMAVWYKDQIVTLAPDEQSLEFRNTDSFKVVKRVEIPGPLVANIDLNYFRQGVLAVPANGSIGAPSDIRRIDNLQPIQASPEFSIYHFQDSWKARPSRYILMSRLSHPAAFAVYDVELNKVIFETASPFAASCELLDERRLAIASLAMGLSVDIIDFTTGKVEQRFRPFAWLLPVIAIGSVMTVALTFAWIYFSSKAMLSLLTTLLVPGFLFGGVLLTILCQQGDVISAPRPNATYFLTVILTVLFMAVWLVFSARGSWMQILAWQLLLVSLIAISLSTLVLQDGFREIWMTAAVLVCLAASALFFWLTIAMTWLIGFRMHWHDSRSNERETHGARNSLGEMFLLTAACVALVVCGLPLRTVPLDARANTCWLRLWPACSLHLPYRAGFWHSWFPTSGSKPCWHWRPWRRAHWSLSCFVRSP